MLINNSIFKFNLHYFSDLLVKITSVKYFYLICRYSFPILCLFFILFFGYGILGGFFLAPPDYQQGEIFRIIYVHVPAAFLSLFVYTIIFFCSILTLVWRIKVADIVAANSASLGASFTFLALVTGALWGKPMWGTFWVWDARLTSELILLFLYFGYQGLRSAISNPEKKARISSLFAIIGMVDIPLIHFSVNWWQTLHQGATIAKFAKPSMPNEMLFPLLSMILAFALFYGLILCLRIQTEILKREKETKWVQMLTMG